MSLKLLVELNQKTADRLIGFIEKTYNKTGLSVSRKSIVEKSLNDFFDSSDFDL